MAITERTIKVAKNIPVLLDQLLSGQTVELVPDQVSLSWDTPDKLIRLSQDRITFQPPAKVHLEWLGVTIKTELHYLQVENSGRTVTVSITGPDITIHLDTSDVGATPGIGDPQSTQTFPTEKETS